MWSEVDFGKYGDKGLTLPQVLIKDPDWFFWAVEKKAFKGPLAAQAAKLARRARGINLPSDKAESHCVQYMFTPQGKFAGFNLIPKTQPPHVGSSSEYREDVLNLAFPRVVKGYDKLGNKLLLKTFKHYWFGGKAFTKAKVEAFFDNPDNFVSF